MCILPVVGTVGAGVVGAGVVGATVVGAAVVGATVVGAAVVGAAVVGAAVVGPGVVVSKILSYCLVIQLLLACQSNCYVLKVLILISRTRFLIEECI